MDYRLISLFALLSWGVWGFLSKLATGSGLPGTVGTWSVLFSLVPVALYALVFEAKSGLRMPLLALPAGLLAGVATLCFYLAMHRGPASVVVPLTGMYILVPALLGFVLLREPVTVFRVLGLVCAGLAVFFLSR